VKDRLTIVYIFERHPALAQTFLKREITELMRQGLRVEIHSLWRARLGAPASDPGSSVFAEYDKLTIHYFRWWEAARLVVALPREWRRDPTLLHDGWRMLRRYRPTSLGNLVTNLWAAVFAVCRAREFRQHKPDLVHGTWATGPATAAAILSRLCRLPFSFGTDGYDVYDRGGDQFLEPKLRAARFVQANFQENADHLRRLVPQSNVILARRGLDQLPPVANTARAPGPIRILSVARLVPKKGLSHQLAACALLKQWGVPFQARIIGRGPLHRQLRRQIDSLGLADVVTLCGGQQHEHVQEAYCWADIFWHTGIVDPTGNRDGLPNVIPEAFAYQLPVISGNVPGATEAVIHEVTGLVVDVADHTALATAVRRLIEDEPLRRHLGENGRRWVEENFRVSRNAGILVKAFRNPVRAPNRSATDRERNAEPLITFIIPVYNCLALTRDCLKSLEETVGNHQWEAIIVDDCSTDGTGEFLTSLRPPYRVLRNETKQSYSASNNRAAVLARGKFLGLLNNDIVLTPGWLEPMLAAFERFPDAGCVGNVQRNPRTGRYDHMGVVFSPGGLHKCFGKHFFFKPLRGCVEWRAVTGACCLVRKTVFDEVGGFDERFVYGCEDIDLCLRLGQAGFKHYVATNSVVYHYVSSSDGRWDFEQRNKQRHLERWADYVQRNRTPRERLLYGVNSVLRTMCRPRA
jgi:colanic acid/amylovoran biosynthesis glycosyltransferase